MPAFVGMTALSGVIDFEIGSRMGAETHEDKV